MEEDKKAGMQEGTSGGDNLSDMGSNKSNGSKKVIIIIAVVLGVLMLIGIGLVFAVISVVKDAVDDYDYESSFDDWDYDSDYDSSFGDVDVTPEQADQIADILVQYDAVVAATDSSVSWTTYLDELDLFLTMMNDLYAIDPDPALLEAIDLMSEAYLTYVLSVNETTDEVTDPDGVDEAYNGVTQGEEFLFDYLEARGY